MVTTSPTSRAAVAARLRLAIARMSRRLRQEAASGLPLSQTSALGTLQERGPLTPSELAAREHLARPGITRIVSRLEAAGLVECIADPNDGRSYRIEITRSGRDLLSAARRRSRAYLSRALERLDPDEVAVLEHAAMLLERVLAEEDSP